MPILNPQKELGNQRDLYEVLGIDKSATAEQIKSAYRKAALKLHPDKNTGTACEGAAAKFQEASTAYNVLSDPQKRQKYDLRGFSGINAADRDLQVDITSLNLFSTVAASLFTNLGVHVKTSLPVKILDTAASGQFHAHQIRVGQPVEGKVDKTQAAFYELEVSSQDIEQGFILGAYSTAGHRIKLLLFEPVAHKSWELQEQEDSISMYNGSSFAALFLSSDRTYVIQPAAGGPEAKANVENQLFQRLDTMFPREHVRVRPGKILVAVYNDNWFKKAQFNLVALSRGSEGACTAALSDVQEQESKLLEMQSTVKKFHVEYAKAQAEWRRASDKFDSLKSEMSDRLKQRDEAYLQLVGGSQPNTATIPAKRGSASWGTFRM